MLKFMQTFLAAKVNAIGIDFGSESLRMAQIQVTDGEPHLIAAASVSIPLGVRKDPAVKLQFLTDSCRSLYTKGGFIGKRAVLALPASSIYVQHIRLPKMDEDSLRKALPWEVRGKIPMDPAQAMIRHITAGDFVQDQEAKLEVILLAARRDAIDQILKAAEAAKLDVVNLQPESKAILDCFRGIFRRKPEAELTTLYIDIGFSGTRVLAAYGEQILFLRHIPIGGDQFNYAASVVLKVPAHQARQRRIDDAENADGADGADGDDPAHDGFDPNMDPMSAKRQAERAMIEEACREPLERLNSELELCRRYHEATFPNRPIELIIFVGGEARQRTLCQQIARRLGIAAQLGDPMVRLGRISKIREGCGLDLNRAQPDWAVAIGLSMGSTAE